MTLTPTTRASLLYRLRDSQDHDAWVEFVEIYEPAISRQLRKYGLQNADAQELQQELFLAVHRQIPKWEMTKDRGSFRGWLHRVTRNLMINWMKHGQRRILAFGGPEFQEMFDNLTAQSCQESQEFELEIRRSVFRRASEFVRQEQSHHSWQAFWGTAVEGKAAGIVARELGISDGAVRVAKCRVLSRLKELVSKWEDDS
jgi:RNA polymerase sigma-70 factor (ECF subfamily)